MKRKTSRKRFANLSASACRLKRLAILRLVLFSLSMEGYTTIRKKIMFMMPIRKFTAKKAISRGLYTYLRK